MKYLYADICESVKKVILDIHSDIPNDKCTRFTPLWTLPCDEFDIMEIIMRMENEYNIKIKNITPLKYAFSFGDLCDMFYNAVNNQPLNTPVKHNTNLFYPFMHMFYKKH